MQPCDPTAETHNSASHDGFIARWSKLSGGRDIEIFGRLNTDLCNVPLVLLLKVPLQIKLTKALPSFYLMNKIADTKTTFKFLDAYLMVRRVEPNPVILLAQESLWKVGPSRGISWRVSTSRILHFRPGLNPGLLTMQYCPLPKRLLFTMIKNSYFNSSVDTNLHIFRHYYICVFSLDVNGGRVPSKGLSLDMDHENIPSWAIGHSVNGPAYITRTRVYR